MPVDAVLSPEGMGRDHKGNLSLGFTQGTEMG